MDIDNQDSIEKPKKKRKYTMTPKRKEAFEKFAKARDALNEKRRREKVKPVPKKQLIESDDGEKEVIYMESKKKKKKRKVEIYLSDSESDSDSDSSLDQEIIKPKNTDIADSIIPERKRALFV